MVRNGTGWPGMYRNRQECTLHRDGNLTGMVRYKQEWIGMLGQWSGMYRNGQGLAGIGRDGNWNGQEWSGMYRNGQG